MARPRPSTATPAPMTAAQGRNPTPRGSQTSNPPSAPGASPASGSRPLRLTSTRVLLVPFAHGPALRGAGALIIPYPRAPHQGRYEVRGTRYEIRDTRYEVRGTRYEVGAMGLEIRGRWHQA